jgi:cysteine-rich repeat protein
MNPRATLLGVVLATFVAHAATVHAAAVVIPDHIFRLGSCGGPDGPACTWECGVGKSCAGGGRCELQPTAGYAAALAASADAAPCGTDTGVVLRFGMAGLSGATPFQLDTAFDLCARDVACTGREPRACGVCADSSLDPLCTSDDGQGNFPCPPGNVLFFCKDPCADSQASVFSAIDLNSLGIWFRETRQPFPAFMRAQLQNVLVGAPAVGRPVFYHGSELDFPTGDPLRTHLCVRFFFTSQEKPLGTCASDPRLSCGVDGDCPVGDTCLSGSPSPSLDIPIASSVVSDSVCAGGVRAGRPCAVPEDCDGGTCDALSASASVKFCSASFTPCASDAGCPGGETCISCPAPACGDGVIDPGEECDDGNTNAGDGCDASCRIEPCTTCDGVLGQQSFCVRASAGTACDLDGTPCTLDTCDASGTCVAGVAPSACAQAVSGKSQLAFSGDPATPEKAKLKWKWASAAAFDTATLGDPSTVDALLLCVFDASGFRFDATAPAGGICGKKPCWKVDPGKIVYKNKQRTPDGVVKLQAKSGEAGKGKAQLQGKGANLALPTTILDGPVEAFLLSGAGPACLQATYSTPDTNTPGVFKAKSD